MRTLLSFLCGALLALPMTAAAADSAATANPKVRLTTSLGVIELELDAQKAPTSVASFLKYVDKGHYNGTIFHRVMPNFMIQGGGLAPGMKEKPVEGSVKNEADNGLKNKVGTVAMARTMDPHSASAQFFINTVDNPFLDHREKSLAGWGYAVFGKVTKGMDVVKKIEATPTHTVAPHENVPIKDVVIQKAERIKS